MSTDRGTLLDIAKRKDPDGSIAMIYEVLNQKNPILQDAPAFPSNAPMAQRVTLRSSLPTVQFAKFNQGTTRSKSSVKQRVDTIGFIDGLSEVDCRLVKVSGRAAVNAHRDSEDKAFVEAMNQLVALTVLYGDELTSPQSFTGLAPRLNALATDIAGPQVRSLGTVVGGDGTSIYVVDWGEDGCHMIYPKDGENVAAGLSIEDKGEQPVQDPESKTFYAEVTQFNWLVGLTVKDPRRINRLCNIDTSDANLEFPTQGSLVMSLIDMWAAMPSKTGFNRVLYTHREIAAAFHKQALNKTNVALSIQEYLGEPMAHFMGCPIRTLDQMSKAESTVS